MIRTAIDMMLQEFPVPDNYSTEVGQGEGEILLKSSFFVQTQYWTFSGFW